MKRTFAAGAAALAFMAAATAGYAGAPPPEITPERAKSIEACMDEATSAVSELDNRTETAVDYYFNNEANKTAIGTALATGQFERDAEQASLLGEAISLLMFNTDAVMRAACIATADEEGNLPAATRNLLLEDARAFYKYDARLLGIMHRLKDEGQKLLDRGHERATANTPGALLFR